MTLNCGKVAWLWILIDDAIKLVHVVFYNYNWVKITIAGVCAQFRCSVCDSHSWETVTFVQRRLQLCLVGEVLLCNFSQVLVKETITEPSWVKSTRYGMC